MAVRLICKCSIVLSFSIYVMHFLFPTPQEAFFGRDLLDTTKEKDIRSSSDSDEECASGAQVSEDKIIQLSQVRSVSNRILSLRILYFILFYFYVILFLIIIIIIINFIFIYLFYFYLFYF